MLSPAEQAIQFVVFAGGVVLFWYGIVPATLATIEHAIGLDKPRRPR